MPQPLFRVMDNIFRGCQNIDDILVGSPSLKEHLKDIELVFRKLKENGLKINLKKCEFLKEELPFLGYLISKNQ